MQDVEFYFCDKTTVQSATLWPLHSGHSMERGTLQYMENGSWKDAAVGTLSEVAQGNMLFIDNTNSEVQSQRWRIHDWRCGGNQRMDGLDLVLSKCAEEFEGNCQHNKQVCTTVTECGQEGNLDDFTWGDKHGLTFQRIHGENDNALQQCDRWGYIGGTNDDTGHASSRISSRNAVFTQNGGENQMQNVEFNFCSAVIVSFAKMWPLHEGHAFERATLQYRDTDDTWKDAGQGTLVGTAQGNAVEMSNSGTVSAHRWRLHNWRTGGNQRVDGIDLKILTCTELQRNCPQ